MDGKSSTCLHCGGPIIETDLLYLNQLERLVSEFFSAACDAEIPFELSAPKEGRDPYLLAIENLLRHVKVYHYNGDGCKEMLASLGKEGKTDSKPESIDDKTHK